jgi:hypothetical protein
LRRIGDLQQRCCAAPALKQRYGEEEIAESLEEIEAFYRKEDHGHGWIGLIDDPAAGEGVTFQPADFICRLFIDRFLAE